MDVYRVDAVPPSFGEWICEVERPFAVNPSAGLLEEIAGAALERENGRVRVLVSAETEATLSEDFLLETRLAEAARRDRLAVGVAGTPLDDQVLFGDETARLVVAVDGTLGVFETERADLIDDLRDKYDGRWEEAEELETRAPARETLFAAGEDRLGESFASDLRSVLAGASTLEWHGTPTPVEVSLVVAARANRHLYDLSRWGEDAGFASRSSLSRSKNELDDSGLLRIERDPQERGRPRQRLLLGEKRLAEAEPEELVPTLRSLLNEVP